MEIGQCFQPDARLGGLRMSRLTGGNDPAFGCRVLACTLVVPARCVTRCRDERNPSWINAVSRTDLDLIGTGDSISLVAASSLLVLLPPRHPESCSTAAARLTQVSVRRIQEQGCLRVYT